MTSCAENRVSCEVPHSERSSGVGMRPLFSIAVFGFPLLLTLPGAQFKAKHLLKHEVVDAFKLVRDFDYSVAMFDINQNGDLDCLTAVRTELDEHGPSATYVWILAGLNGKEKKNITFHVRAGSAPDKPVFTIGDGDYPIKDHEPLIPLFLIPDGPEQIANFIYTDYKTCSVFEVPFRSLQECMLWVTRDAKDNVPENCVDQFEDSCDVKNVSYDKDSCTEVVA